MNRKPVWSNPKYKNHKLPQSATTPQHKRKKPMKNNSSNHRYDVE